MMKTSLKTLLALSAVVSVVSCGKTIDSLIEDEIGDRVNDAAGDRLFLLHGETTLNGKVKKAAVSRDGSGNVSLGSLGSNKNGSVTLVNNFGTTEEVVMARGSDDRVYRKSSGAEIKYDRARGLTLQTTSADGTSRGFVGNEHILDYDHQTYGMWLDGIGESTGSVTVGSFGTATASGNVPTSGTATYRGNSVGYAVGADQRGYVTESEVAMSTSDFSSVTFSSTSTTARAVEGGPMVIASHLNFNGSGTISGTEFSANVAGTQIPSSTTTGVASGRFYGDNGEEIGGTFELNGPIGSYVGAFGADQSSQ